MCKKALRYIFALRLRSVFLHPAEFSEICAKNRRSSIFALRLLIVYGIIFGIWHVADMPLQ